MANVQIPNLPAVAALSGAELFEGVQAGTSVKISLGQVIAATRTGTPTTLPLPVADGGTGASTAPNARTNLGLGTMSTQDANAVAITGGSITGITDLAVADGGTGASTLTGYVKGGGTTPLTASATIPSTDITGLGTMSTQNANSVAITGGSINGTTIGASTPSTIAGTTGTFTDIVSVTVSSASDAVRITQTGAGNSFVVEDSANPDSTPFVVTTTGDVGIGITAPTTKLDVVGTANATNMTRGGSQVYSRDNILAAVSQAAGVPTGGIIERGSSANGEYIRYADGTMICVIYAAGTQTTLTASGTIFRATNASTWTFPSTFAVAPAVSGMAEENNARWVAFDLPTTTGVAFRHLNSLSSPATVNTRLMAIGRWF